MARKREWDERKLRKEKYFNREGEGRLLRRGHLSQNLKASGGR